MNYSIGIDMGGTNTDLGLVSPEGKIMQRRSVKTNKYTDFQLYVHDLSVAIDDMIAAQQLTHHDIDGIGIGAPNANYYTGCVEYAMNLTMKGLLNFREEFGRYFKFPVTICNDASAAAYGEYVYGGAKNIDDFVLFTLGTGVGSGIVIGGHLLLGVKGSAGELGHIQIVPGGRLCSCGRRGCVEAYCAARGIKQTYAELLAEHESLHKVADEPVPEGWMNPHTAICDISCKTIGDAANAGDPIALATFARTAEYLSVAMATAVAFCAPKAIFLMGGPAQVGDPLLKPLQEAYERNLLYNFKGTCQIRMSELAANDVAILGASALIYNK